jgi:uncharacterized repeat protein (TIGR02543 family)
MNKIIKVALLGLTVTSLFSCGNGKQSSNSGTWTVQFMLNNGTEDIYKEIVVENNKTISESIADPTRNGYTFDGWYIDQACTTYFDEVGDQITSNMKVYAKWAASGIANPDTPGQGDSGDVGGDVGGDTGEVNELPGSTDAVTEGFALLFNDTNYVALVSLGDEKDFQGRDQYAAKGVVVPEGAIFKCYNSADGAIWAEKVLEPYGVCDPKGEVCFESTNDGIKCLVSGTYDIYVKMKWEDNTIYIGPAGA